MCGVIALLAGGDAVGCGRAQGKRLHSAIILCAQRKMRMLTTPNCSPHTVTANACSASSLLPHQTLTWMPMLLGRGTAPMLSKEARGTAIALRSTISLRHQGSDQPQPYNSCIQIDPHQAEKHPDACAPVCGRDPPSPQASLLCLPLLLVRGVRCD